MSSVINTNISSLIAQRSLAQNNTNLNTSLERLSTGLRSTPVPMIRPA